MEKFIRWSGIYKWTLIVTTLITTYWITYFVFYYTGEDMPNSILSTIYGISTLSKIILTAVFYILLYRGVKGNKRIRIAAITLLVLPIFNYLIFLLDPFLTRLVMENPDNQTLLSLRSSVPSTISFALSVVGYTLLILSLKKGSAIQIVTIIALCTPTLFSIVESVSSLIIGHNHGSEYLSRTFLPSVAIARVLVIGAIDFIMIHLISKAKSAEELFPKIGCK